MKNVSQTVVFDRERAASYDERAARLAPTRDALHLLTRIVLADLPADARVLCVGVGTGAELLTLAQAFPGWHFTAVDPASAMLNVCREQANAHGVADRCTFHEGYLDSLPAMDPFDAATCLLVSHFFADPDARRDFFGQIAARLGDGGYLVSADLAADLSSAEFNSLRDVWVRMLHYAGYPPEDIEKFCASYGRETSVLPPRDVEALLVAGGFTLPVQFYQNLLIHAWYARKG